MPEEIDTLAAKDEEGTVAVLLWRHTDDQYQLADQDTPVVVHLAGLQAAGYTLQHLRIDAAYSNAHSVWRSLGSPQDPTAEQLAAIAARQGLEALAEPQDVTPTEGALALQVSLPLPSVSLLVLTARAPCSDDEHDTPGKPRDW